MAHHLFYNKNIFCKKGVEGIAISSEMNDLLYLIIVQIKQIVPFWVLGLIVGTLISTYGGKRLHQVVCIASRKQYNLFKILFASVLGAVSPVTMHGMIPIIAALMKFQVSQAVITSFMITSVLINPNVFIYSLALGAEIAVLRLILCILAGAFAGLFVEIFFKDKKLYELSGFEDVEDHSKKVMVDIRQVFKNLKRAIGKTAPNFVLGIALAAFFQMYFPTNGLDIIFSQNKGLSILFAASLGVPAYFCGGGTIPLIKVWMMEGMSAGSVVAFMITGPATKFTNITAVKIIMPVKHFLFYIAYNITFGIVAGIVIDLIYGLLK